MKICKCCGKLKNLTCFFRYFYGEGYDEDNWKEFDKYGNKRRLRITADVTEMYEEKD